MSLSALTKREAVLSAIEEYDQSGRDAFLARYGYKPARGYFLSHAGKLYDSKAIAGVAFGKQFPNDGPLRSEEFSGGDATVRSKLEELGFQVVGPEVASPLRITASDIETLRESRLKDRYANLSPDERATYKHVHSTLAQLGRIVADELGGRELYEVRLTSGFHVESGVRGAIPKDLWFGVFRRENKDPFVGNPQLYAIVSGRGVELGFAASTHPSDFSNQEIKARLRAAAPKIYHLLPEPGSGRALSLEPAIGEKWQCRRKSRLEPGRSEFPGIRAWLDFFKSPSGGAEGGGAISRYLNGPELDASDLPALVREMAQTFRPLMEQVAPARIGGSVPDGPETESPNTSFAELIRKALAQFDEARAEPYRGRADLWATMDAIQQHLHSLTSLRGRPHIITKWSLGKGVWAAVPWIALLSRNVTTTTQEGLYVAILIAEDLSAIYFTLIQGSTELLNELGQKAATRTLLDRAAIYRAQIGDLAEAGITLDNNIDLKSDGVLARNYQTGTIAYARFGTDKLPSDEEVEHVTGALLSAYDVIVERPPAPPPEVPVDIDTSGPSNVEEEPYSLDDAASGLFMSRDELRRILVVWRAKRNIVLQGAPGVGKSFVAKRLAYALIERQAPSRVEMVQFHQSYAYEDFIQGYRPTAAGGFTLRDGMFTRFCNAARNDPENDYVLIIDEINRGNLSKIFGEAMLLIEHDKRSPGWATRLTYAREEDDKFYIPENLFIIGMMNTADRSLSLVDYALRRRFAFITLQPQFRSDGFRDYLTSRGVPEELIGQLVARMTELNEAIASDTINLGPGFQIGHSFFVPGDAGYNDGWYEQIVETEIRPLIEEYWADDSAKAADWCARLLKKQS